MRKYVFEHTPVVIDGVSYRRIRANVDIPFHGVHKGDIGGLIESEENLSHNGFCWVGRDARVSGGSKVTGAALVSGHAIIAGGSNITGSAKVSGNARVYNSKISDSVMVFSDSTVQGSTIRGGVKIHGSAAITDSEISGIPNIADRSCISGVSMIAEVGGYFLILGKSSDEEEEDSDEA